VGHYKIGFLGIDIWQVKSGTIFDDILVTDSEEEATEYFKDHIAPKQVKEKAAKEKLDEVERKKAEEEAAKNPPPAPPASPADEDDSDIHDEL
jgi:calreticulin